MSVPIEKPPSSSQRTRCRVMILVTGTHRRGAEVFAEQLSGAIKERGWECRLVALSASGTQATISAQVLFEENEGAGLGGLNLGVVRRLRGLFRSERPSVVLAGGGATLKYSVAAMMGLRGRPTLVYSSIGEPEYWATSKLRRRFLKWMLGRADLITAVSQTTADQLVRSFGVAANKVRVAPTGVPDRFLDIEGSGPSPELRTLFIGSLSSEKNPLGALEAHHRMTRPSLLRVVGDGPLIEEVRAQALDHGGVEVIGSVDDVAPHLRWADVLVLTSRTEGLPGVALEAAAAGVPVVTFDVGGISEIVAHNTTGLLVPPGDVAGLSRQLDRLADDPRLRAEMSIASREKVRSHFLMSHSVARYQVVLEEACSRGGTGRLQPD